MIAKITLSYDPTSVDKLPEERVQEIIRTSYDCQHDNVVYDITDRNAGLAITRDLTFTLYLDECDQTARTREFLRAIESLIEDYM